MVLSDRANQQAGKRNPVDRSESIRSEKSDRKVSFNKAVGVKHIPKGIRGKSNSPTKVVKPPLASRPTSDEWNDCSQVLHEPVSLDSNQLVEAAEDLVRVVDTIDCGATGNTAYRSLDRPSKSKNHHNHNYNNYQHHNYSNVVFNNHRGGGSKGDSYHNLSSGSGSGGRPNNHSNSGSRGENYHNLSSGSGGRPNNHSNSGSRGENYHNLSSGSGGRPNNHSNSGGRGENYHNPGGNSGRSKNNNNYYNNYNNLDTRTLPANKQNNQNNNHLKTKHFHQSADPLPNPASPLVHSNRHGFKLTNHNAYKSVPDLHNQHSTTNIGEGDFNQQPRHEGDSGTSTYQHYHDYRNRQPTSDMTYHNYNNSRKVERIIRKFNQETRSGSPDSYNYHYPATTTTSTLPRGAVEPDGYNNHNNNQPFSYTSSNRIVSMETIRKLSPSPDSSAPAYAHVNKKRNSDDFSHRTWDADHYSQRKRNSNDYSAKIIITDDYDDFNRPRDAYPDDDDDAYESYQIPSDQFKILTEKTVTHSNNINMSSIGVQTDQSDNRGQNRSRPKTRTVTSPQGRPRTGPKHDPVNPKFRNPSFTTKIHNDLTSATLVRQINHGFGRHDRSPSPPPVPATYTGVRTGKHVVPLLSDTSDSEYEVRRTADPLARIRSQVMERERLQEEEEEEEQRGRRIRTPGSTLDSQPRSYSHHDMTPLTVDEVDALSLVMESDTGTQALVVANQSQSVTRTTRSRAKVSETSVHTETRTQKRESKRDSLPRLSSGRSASRETTPHREIKKPEEKTEAGDTEEEVEVKKTEYGTKEQPVDDKKAKKKEKKKKQEQNTDTRKKKRRIKIKFFYDPRPDDDDADPLSRFEEFKGEEHDLEEGEEEEERRRKKIGGREDLGSSKEELRRSKEDVEGRGMPDGRPNRSLSDKYSALDQSEVEVKKQKKKFLSMGKDGGRKGGKEPRGTTTSTTNSYTTTSLGRPRGREARSKPAGQSQGFSTLQQPMRGRPGRGGGGGGGRESESSTSPPRVVHKAKLLKPRYFGDTDLEEPATTTTKIPSTTTTNIRGQRPPQLPPSKLPPSAPGDYRSLPNRVQAKNSKNSPSTKTSPRRLSRGRSPASMASSESEVDSHASKASHVSTGSNRSVYLHATAVADIPVRHRQPDRQTDRQSDRQADKQTRKVTRSFSLLSPWKPRHYKERYEVDYERKTPAALPPRPPRRPMNQQQQQQQQQKSSRLLTWLGRKRNREAKGI